MNTIFDTRARHLIATALVLIACASCGRPDDSSDQTGDQSGGDAQNFMAVNGVAGFGSQCPYGSVSDVSPVSLGMYDCSIGLNEITLAQNIEPLYLSADCKNKIISARTADRRIDTNWYALPDKSFFFTITGLNAELQSDGNGGHTNCTTPLSIDISGTLGCDENNPSRDQADMQIDVVMWAGKNSPPSNHTPSQPASPIPLPSPTPSSSPNPHPTPHPSEGPHPWPWPWPTGGGAPTPTSTPTGAPPAMPLPIPTAPSAGSGPAPAPLPLPGNHVIMIGSADYSISPKLMQCTLPKSCYLYANTDVKQCQ